MYMVPGDEIDFLTQIPKASLDVFQTLRKNICTFSKWFRIGISLRSKGFLLEKYPEYEKGRGWGCSISVDQVNCVVTCKIPETFNNRLTQA